MITKPLTFSYVPRAGIEPARLAALVFETNASTNSAIWACNFRIANAKVRIILEMTKKTRKKLLSVFFLVFEGLFLFHQHLFNSAFFADNQVDALAEHVTALSCYRVNGISLA